MDYQIVAVSNKIPHEWYFCYQEFFKSLPNDEVLLLGQTSGDYLGLSDRPRIIYDAFKNGLIKSKYIFVVDNWDLVFVDSPEIILEKWKAMNCDLVISNEKNCFPSELIERFDELDAPTSYKYLNCGTIIGNTEAYLTVLEDMDAANVQRDYRDEVNNCNVHFNDQILYQKSFFNQPVKIKLDYYQDIMNCLQDVDVSDLDFSDDRIRNIECNTTPSGFHWNGGSKSGNTQEKILKHLKLR